MPEDEDAAYSACITTLRQRDASNGGEGCQTTGQHASIDNNSNKTLPCSLQAEKTPLAETRSRAPVHRVVVSQVTA